MIATSPTRVHPAEWSPYDGDPTPSEVGVPASGATTARNPVIVHYSQELRASAPPPPPPTQDSRFFPMAPKYQEPTHHY